MGAGTPFGNRAVVIAVREGHELPRLLSGNECRPGRALRSARPGAERAFSSVVGCLGRRLFLLILLRTISRRGCQGWEQPVPQPERRKLYQFGHRGAGQHSNRNKKRRVGPPVPAPG